MRPLLFRISFPFTMMPLVFALFVALVATPLHAQYSDMPSMMPSDVPSTMPSTSPSYSDYTAVSSWGERGTAMSDVPSMMPSDVPSMMPSDSPSMMPSDAPSINPTAYTVGQEGAGEATDFVSCSSGGDYIKTDADVELVVRFKYDLQLPKNSDFEDLDDEGLTPIISEVEKTLSEELRPVLCAKYDESVAVASGPDDLTYGKSQQSTCRP